MTGPPFLVLTGPAGSGKTAMLARLAAAGEQVLDLEALAVHRGSSYGRIGLAAPQPSEPAFHAAIERALAGFDPGRPVWVEDEGPHLGSLWLPAPVVGAIAAAETVALAAGVEERVGRLVDTYWAGDPVPLVAATQRIRRRLGNPRTDRAISHFQARRPEAAVRALLEYFDHGYALRAERTRRRPAEPGRLPAALAAAARDDLASTREGEPVVT